MLTKVKSNGESTEIGAFKDEVRELIKKHGIVAKNAVGQIILHLGEGYGVKDVQIDVKLK